MTGILFHVCSAASEKSTPGRAKESLPPYSTFFRQHAPRIGGIGGQLVSFESGNGKQFELYLVVEDEEPQGIDGHADVVVVLRQELGHIHG